MAKQRIYKTPVLCREISIAAAGSQLDYAVTQVAWWEKVLAKRLADIAAGKTFGGAESTLEEIEFRLARERADVQSTKAAYDAALAA